MNQILNSRNSQFYVLIYQYPQLDMEINLELEHSLVEHVQFPAFICLGNNEKVYWYIWGRQEVVRRMSTMASGGANTGRVVIG